LKLAIERKKHALLQEFSNFRNEEEEKHVKKQVLVKTQYNDT